MIEAADRGPNTLLDYDRLITQIGGQRVSDFFNNVLINEFFPLK